VTLPSEWPHVPIREIADVNPGPSRSLVDDEPVSFVPMASVRERGGGIAAAAIKLTRELRRKSYRYFEENDVIMAKITPCFENGKIAVAQGLKSGRAFGSTEFHVLRPRGGAVDTAFLKYFLESPDFTARATRSMTGGVGQLRVPTRMLRETLIPLPPLSEQRRTVAVIEEQLTRLDAAARLLGASESRSARLSSTVLQACLAGGRLELPRLDQPTLFGLPSGWKSCRMGDVVTEVRYGTSTKCDYAGRGAMVLRIPNIRDRQIDWTDVKQAVDTAEDLSRLHVLSGDVLVIRTNGSRSLIGRVGLVDHDYKAAFASYLIRLRPNVAHMKPAYLAAVLSSPSYRAVIEARAATTAGQYNLGVPALVSLPVPVPPLETQEQLIAEVERWESVINSARASCARASRRAQSLRRSILSSAFTGKLVNSGVAAQTGAVPTTGFVAPPNELAQ
jgi:type I restriction enzyme S subunit